MGAYLMKFPRARIVTLVFIFFFIFTFDVPAWAHADLLVRDAAFRRASEASATRKRSQGGTAFFAHVGGFIAGIVLVSADGHARALLAPPGSLLVNEAAGHALHARRLLPVRRGQAGARARRGASADFDYEEFDIDRDPELRRLYNDEVPVIAINRREGLQIQSGHERISEETGGARMSLDVLAIAAHPDDVEQTCGGTLIRMAEMGYRTGVLDLTAGDMGTRGTPEQRVAESRSGGAAHAAGVARQPALSRCAPGKHPRRAHDAGDEDPRAAAAGGDSAVLGRRAIPTTTAAAKWASKPASWPD